MEQTQIGKESSIRINNENNEEKYESERKSKINIEEKGCEKIISNQRDIANRNRKPNENLMKN